MKVQLSETQAMTVLALAKQQQEINESLQKLSAAMAELAQTFAMVHQIPTNGARFSQDGPAIYLESEDEDAVDPGGDGAYPILM
jgi:hypothetical protein